MIWETHICSKSISAARIKLLFKSQSKSKQSQLMIFNIMIDRMLRTTDPGQTDNQSTSANVILGPRLMRYLVTFYDMNNVECFQKDLTEVWNSKIILYASINIIHQISTALGVLTLIRIHKLTMTLLFSLEIDSRGSIVRKLVRKAFKKYLQKHMEFSICQLTFFMFLK